MSHKSNFCGSRSESRTASASGTIHQPFWTAAAAYRSRRAVSSPLYVGPPINTVRSSRAFISYAQLRSANAIRRFFRAARWDPARPDELAEGREGISCDRGRRGTGINPADPAPEHWHHVHNRLSVSETPRPYTHTQHQAWLRRQRNRTVSRHAIIAITIVTSAAISL
jgi:hypothetical protein